MSNFHPFVGDDCETQLEVGENFGENLVKDNFALQGLMPCQYMKAMIEKWNMYVREFKWKQ